MRLIVLILLLFALPAWATDTALVDRDGVTQTLVLSPANIGAASTAQARQGATYTILPYGDTRLADYYCTATDCGPAFQSALNAAKSSGKGGLIKLLEGTYPVATSAVGNDAHSVIIEGVSPMGMWGDGGTIIRRTANVTVFDFSLGTPMACEVSRIHFTDAATYSAPVLKYVNASNMGQFHNYFDGTAQAIFAERAWDFWTEENNFRNCGTGDTKDTACITIFNGATDKAAHWTIGPNNRFETRTGTSIYSDVSGASGKGNDTILIALNKFEGVDGAAYPAVHGVFWNSRVIGNSVFKADTSKPPIWIVNYNSIYSGVNVVQGNTIHEHKDYGISVVGNGNNVGNNGFCTSYTPSSHVRVASGSGNGVGLNTRCDTIPLLSDAGTGTFDVSTLVDNTAYNSTSWDGDATHAPSKDAMRDKIESLAAQISAAGGGTVVNVSSADGNATVTNPTVSPVITVVAAPKLATGRQVNGVVFDGTSDVGQDLKTTASPSFANAMLVPSYGATIVTNGTFDDATGWGGINWVSAGGKWTHTPGSVNNFGLSTPITLTAGTAYRLTFDISGMTAGTLTPSFGGITGPAYSVNGTSITVNGVATSTATPLFAPSTDFNGSIDNVSLQPITGGALTAAGNIDAIGGVSGRSLNLTSGDHNAPGVTMTHSVDTASGNPIISGRRSRGTPTAPTATQSGDTLAVFSGAGYGTSGWLTASGFMTIAAAEAFTSTAKGAYIGFTTAATGTTTRTEKLRINPGGMQTEGLDDKTASFTVVNSTSRITLATGTATATLKKDLPAGTTSVLVTVAGAAASGVSFAAESGGSLSWGDAGTPTFTNNKTADVVCTSENATATSTAAWRCVKGGNF